MDTTNIELSVSSFATAVKLGRDLIAAVKNAAAREKLAEMNAAILDAQGYALSAQTDRIALDKQINELENKLSRLIDFRQEKRNYKLRNIGDTAFVYVYEPKEGSDIPSHWLCASCCDQDKKSILQEGGRDQKPGGRNYVFWNCPVCKSRVRVTFDQHP